MKSKIVKVGYIDQNGQPAGWIFDLEGNPKSIGVFLSPSGNLYGGYTVEELRDISEKAILTQTVGGTNNVQL